MVIKMEFKTLSDNKHVYLHENGIVYPGRAKTFCRNRTLEESPAHPFYKVFILTWQNYLKHAIGATTKNRRCKKMVPSTWCAALCAGNNGGYFTPLVGCDPKPLAEG